MLRKFVLMSTLMSMSALVDVCGAEHPMIQNETLRVQTEKHGDRVTLRFDARMPGKPWRTVLSNVAVSKNRPWETGTRTSIEDIEGGPFFTKAVVEDNGKTLVLQGEADNRRIEQRIALVDDGHVYVLVKLKVDGDSTQIDRLMNHFYFVPDGRSMGHALPMDFAWLPGLHSGANDVAGDWFFRSPAAVIVSRGLHAAMVPDLDIMVGHPKAPHALDLRSWDHAGAGGTYGLPRLSYGLCPWRHSGHVFTAKGGAVTVNAEDLVYGFDLFVGASEGPEHVLENVRSLLWEKYGHKYFQDIRPQVLPFEAYARKYSYAHELFYLATKVPIDGKEGYGLNNAPRRGANFHAWENDLHVGFGVWYYGNKWKNEKVKQVGEGIMRLSLSAPMKEGAFPCVYNFAKKQWEGSLYWTSWPAHPYDGYDIQSMSVSTWWRLYWYENFDALTTRSEIPDKVIQHARFLAKAQLPSGAIPTYYDADLRPAAQLREAAPTAIAGAVLAKAAMLRPDDQLKEAAIAAGRFLEREILPKSLFQDFEVFYSCAPKALYWVDPVNGIPPINNLAIQWSADHFLALYKLTGDRHWLNKGEYCLSLLSMFHQVWAPKRFGGSYLYGGFGVMNCDGEWNDGRQARFVPTYADFYKATGNLEYLERAVAACRASFAAMDIEENHANHINQYSTMDAGKGYAPESLMHGAPHTLRGRGGGWNGFNWGPGGGLGASAYLEIHFGSVWIDGRAERAVPIDGVSAEITSWQKDRIVMKIENALADLPHPFTEARKLTVKFGHLPLDRYTVKINGRELKNMTRHQLTAGIEIDVPKVER